MSKPLDELLEDYRDKFGDFPTTWEMTESVAVAAVEKALETGVPMPTPEEVIGDEVEPATYQM